MAWLVPMERAALLKVLVLADFQRGQIMLGEAALATEAHILLTGVARITCLNLQGARVTVALLGPGPIAQFPSWDDHNFKFQCCAYRDCRVGSMSRNDFDRITRGGAEPGARRMREHDLRQCFRLIVRGSTCISLGLRDRVAHTLIELCAEFGVEDSRGTLLRECFSHEEIAQLVGASRPRVTEHLAQLETERLVQRQGRQLIVRVRELADAIAPRDH